MKALKNVLLFIWQLPQHIVAGFIFLFCKTEKLYDYKGKHVYKTSSFGGAISLGNYIIVSRDEETTVIHEYGHTIQSVWLGPFYLFVIGIPSIVWAMSFNCRKRTDGKTYYWFYTEKWANKLGGVKVVIYGTRPCQYRLEKIAA